MYLQQRGICFCLIQAVTSQSCLVFLADLNCKRGDSKLEDLVEEVFDLVFEPLGSVVKYGIILETRLPRHVRP